MGMRLHGGSWIQRGSWRLKEYERRKLELYHRYHGCWLPTARPQDAQRKQMKTKKWAHSVQVGTAFSLWLKSPNSILKKMPQTSWIRENFRVRRTFTSITPLSSATVTLLACLHGNTTNFGPVSLSNDLKNRALRCLT